MTPLASPTSPSEKGRPAVVKAAGWILFFIAMLAVFTALLHAVLGPKPMGADFYTFWLATRATFVEGKNPYSAEVTQESQLGIYGRPATPDQDQVAFAYPPYSMLALLPVAWMDYGWAEAYWMALNVLLIIAAFFFAFAHAPKWLVFTYLLLYPVTFGILLGNFVVIIGTFLLFFYGWFIERRTPSPWPQGIMGICLAWSTCKPQFIWLLGIVVLLVSWRRQYRWLLGSFFAALAVMLGISFLLVPAWPIQWIARVGEYSHYVQSSPAISQMLAEIMPGNIAMTITLVAALAAVILSVILLRKWWHGALSDLFLFAWAGFLTYFFHLHGISYEQLSFLVPLACWAAVQGTKPTRQTVLFWFIPLILSWAIFVVSKWYLPAADKWPVLYNLIFLIWLYRSQSKPTAIPAPNVA
jgi:Glycosyltransferase family 87